jgi:phosphoserine phosphatase
MKLLVLDVEGTIFDKGYVVPGAELTSTIWQGLALALGPAAVGQEAFTHETWKNHGYRTYVDWMKDTIRIHVSNGLKQSTFDSVVGSAVYNNNVPAFFDSLDRAAYQPVLVSGGFSELARRAQIDFGIHHAFAACEYYFDSDGNFASYNLLPCDFEGKIDFIRLMLAEYGLGQEDWVFVGDGANDVPIARAAPHSVAYQAHPELAAVASVCLDDFEGLASLLASFE